MHLIKTHSKMKTFINKTYLLGIAIFLTALIGCDDNEALVEVTTPVAVSFELSTDTIEIAPGTQYELIAQLTAPSNEDITISFVIDNEDEIDSEITTADESHFQIPNSNITIPSGDMMGLTNINFEFDNLQLNDPRKLVLDMDSGNATANITREQIEINYIKQCIFNDIELRIQLDDYPEETSWSLYNLDISNSVPIIQAGPFGNIPGGSVITFPLCLEAGNYAIVIWDSFGDGILDGGGFSMTLDGEALVLTDDFGNPISGSVSGSFAIGYFTLE